MGAPLRIGLCIGGGSANFNRHRRREVAITAHFDLSFTQVGHTALHGYVGEAIRRRRLAVTSDFRDAICDKLLAVKHTGGKHRHGHPLRDRVQLVASALPDRLAAIDSARRLPPGYCRARDYYIYV